MSADERGGRRRWPAVLTVFGLLAIVVGYVQAIAGAERVLRAGTPLLLELAPRDPRAFLTGDYMVIDLALARQAGERESPGDRPDPAAEGGRPDDGRQKPRRDGYAIVTLDARGVAILDRLAERADALGPGELALVARHRESGWRIGTDAFYFPEGQGRRYQAARYGDYRLSPAGELLLVRLLDERFQPLPMP